MIELLFVSVFLAACVTFYNSRTKSQKTQKEDPLCSMCKTYKPVPSEMGDEFCFACLVKRFKQVKQ